MSAAGSESAGASGSGKHGIANALMLVTTFCWASNIVAGKEALTGFDPFALAQLRMTGAAILYIVMYLAWRGRPKLRLGRREWLMLALMALTGITFNQICYISGLARTSVTHTGLIQAIGPVVVLLLSTWMGMECLTHGKILGMAISFLGVILLLMERPEQGSAATWLGDLLVIAAGGFFAYYTVLVKKSATRYDPLTANALVFGLGTIFLVPFCLGSVARIRWSLIPLHAWWGLGYMVLFGSFVAYLIYAFALERLSASNVAAFAYLQPVMAALMGMWLLGERISVMAVAGGALILFGVYFTERARGEETVRMLDGSAVQAHPCLHVQLREGEIEVRNETGQR